MSRSRRQIALGALALLPWMLSISGCGTSSDESVPSVVDTVTANSGSMAVNSGDHTGIDSTAKIQAAQPIELGIPGELPHDGSSTFNTTESSEATDAAMVSEVPEAREAFQILITPGSESAAWDAAQRTLVDLGASSVPTLLRGLSSTQAIERETAATVCALMETIDPALQTALVKCLSDESPFVRANVAAALTSAPECHSQVIAALSSLLEESDPQLRRMAAANLGAFGEEAKSALPSLTAVLADSDAEVVTPVIELLGRIGPQAIDAVPQLQKIAFEQDGEVRQAAEQALLLIQSDAEVTNESK